MSSIRRIMIGVLRAGIKRFERSPLVGNYNVSMSLLLTHAPVMSVGGKGYGFEERGNRMIQFAPIDGKYDKNDRIIY